VKYFTGRKNNKNSGKGRGMRIRNNAFVLLCAFVAFLLLFALDCSNSSSSSNGGGGGSGVTVTRNDILFFRADISSGNGTSTFGWDNTKSRAEYRLELFTGTAGSVRAIISDDKGTVVVNRDIPTSDPDSTWLRMGSSSPGSPGTWSIDLILTDFNGTGSFQCDGAD
jgi:hypothetical protein